MNLSEMKSVWQEYDSKLEQSINLNRHCLELIQTQNVKSRLEPILWFRIIELTLHGTAIALLVAFIANNLFLWPYSLSAFVLLTFYIVASSNCIKQIMIIRKVDNSNDIVTLQSSLALLRTHVVNFTRLAVLFIPTFLAYPMVVSKAIEDLGLKSLSFMDIRAGYHGNWWSIQITVSIILIPLCIWFYRQVSYKNIHIKWVKDTIRKFAGSRIEKSIEFLQEVETLKQDMR